MMARAIDKQTFVSRLVDWFWTCRSRCLSFGLCIIKTDPIVRGWVRCGPLVIDRLVVVDTRAEHHHIPYYYLNRNSKTRSTRLLLARLQDFRGKKNRSISSKQSVPIVCLYIQRIIIMFT